VNRCESLECFGWVSSRGRFATSADSRIKTRKHMNTYAAKVWDLSIVQGPFSVAPSQTLVLRFANFAPLYVSGAESISFTETCAAAQDRDSGGS
jgi:hypothetical protein